MKKTPSFLAKFSQLFSSLKSKYPSVLGFDFDNARGRRTKRCRNANRFMVKAATRKRRKRRPCHQSRKQNRNRALLNRPRYV